MDGEQPQRSAARGWLLVTLGVTLALIVAAAIWASADPDGLERVAQDLGFADAGREPGFQLLPDYSVPGVDGVGSTILAGLLGVAVVLRIVLLVGRLLARRRA